MSIVAKNVRKFDGGTSTGQKKKKKTTKPPKQKVHYSNFTLMFKMPTKTKFINFTCMKFILTIL